MIHPEYGVICQANLDMGDAPHRTGIFLLSLAERQLYVAYEAIYRAAIKCFKTPKGYIRGGAYCETEDFSRDQASRLFLGFSYCIEGERFAKEYYSHVLKHSFVHPNGDLIGIGEIIFLIRLYKKWYLYPLLLILDLKFFIDFLIMKFSKKARWDYASLCVPDLIHGERNYPTPWIYLAQKLYASKYSTVEGDMLFNHSIDKNGAVEIQLATTYFFNRFRKKGFI